MLKEERINGVKIGSHWRFSRSKIDRLIKPDQEETKQKIDVSADALPVHCIKPIQDVFSEIAQIAVVTASDWAAGSIPVRRFVIVDRQ